MDYRALFVKRVMFCRASMLRRETLNRGVDAALAYIDEYDWDRFLLGALACDY